MEEAEEGMTKGMQNPIFKIMNINNMKNMPINQMNMNMMNNNLTINNNSNNIEMNMTPMDMMLQNMMNSCQRIPQSNNQQVQEILDGNKNSDNDYLVLRFEQRGKGRYYEICIQCSYNEKVSDVIERYRQKSGDYSSTKFYFNSKDLFRYNEHDPTVLEAGLSNLATVYAQTTGGMYGGGYSMMFTDTSKNKTREIKFSKEAPSYCVVDKGINIFGICNFKKCKAYKKDVVVNVKKKKLDLIKERDELFCPECEATITPKTVGFHLCKFQIYGKKLENGKEESFRNKEDEANNKDGFKYFDPELNGEVMVTELVFEVLEYL